VTLYDHQHRKDRRRWATIVGAGLAVCARCNKPILEGEAWDLGHADTPGQPSQPEHRACNRSAGAAALADLNRRARAAYTDTAAASPALPYKTIEPERHSRDW
jgi:hypothetical protein